MEASSPNRKHRTLVRPRPADVEPMVDHDEHRSELMTQSTSYDLQAEVPEESDISAKHAAVLKPLSKRRVEKYNEALKNRGVVYISRIPPFMKPAKVKHLLSHYGEVSRIYLVEEDPSARKARGKLGGNRSKRYTEGWVEFTDKKIAKAVALSLNNTKIGGSKRDYHHEDLWNLKYLRHFKWDHLTEKVAYERRVRDQKLRLETMQAKRENALYVEMVEKGKTFAKMEERKRKRTSEGGGDLAEQPAVRRKFLQAKPAGNGGLAGESGKHMDTNVLKALFSRGGKADT